MLDEIGEQTAAVGDDPFAQGTWCSSPGALALSCCSYCASVHGKRFTELTKAPEVMERIQHDGVEAALDPRRKAILDYAAKLMRDPAAIGPPTPPRCARRAWATSRSSISPMRSRCSPGPTG